jgi:hypothetical protein
MNCTGSAGRDLSNVVNPLAGLARRNNMNRRILSLALIPTAIVLALAACSTGSGSGGTGGSSATGGASAGASSGGPHGAGTRCITGTWDLDVSGSADQMLTYLTAKHVPISSATGSGPITLDVAGDGTMTYTTGATYTFDADLNGQPMVITQVQAGSSHGSWSWASGSELTLDFSHWTSAITFTTKVTVAGREAEVPFDIPDSGPGSTPLATSCTASTLTLTTSASPFTLTFHRE